MENKPKYNAEEGNQKEGKYQDEKKHGITPAQLDAITGSATENVRARTHSGDTPGNTGANTSYEGPTSTSPAGTGYNSGQSATGSSIATNSEYDAAHTEQTDETKDEEHSEEKDIV